MKSELLIALGVAWWIALLGFIAPALVSSRSNEGVALGVALIFATTYSTYRLARRAFTKKEADEHV